MKGAIRRKARFSEDMPDGFRLGFVPRQRLNACPYNHRRCVMKKVAINETELAERWGLSPKTLQRWRSEGK